MKFREYMNKVKVRRKTEGDLEIPDGTEINESTVREYYWVIRDQLEFFCFYKNCEFGGVPWLDLDGIRFHYDWYHSEVADCLFSQCDHQVRVQDSGAESYDKVEWHLGEDMFVTILVKGLHREVAESGHPDKFKLDDKWSRCMSCYGELDKLPDGTPDPNFCDVCSKKLCNGCAAYITMESDIAYCPIHEP